MTNPPILRALMQSGETWDDPSEDLLFELMSDIDAGAEQFMIVERLADTSTNTYAQTCVTDDGRFQVEYRDGGSQRHFQAFTPELRVAHAAITGWAFGLPGWRDTLSWERLDLP